MNAEVRAVGAGEALAVARLLIAFNTEYDEPVPRPEWLTRRIGDLLRDGATDALLLEVEGVAAGVAVQRYRPSLWEPAIECHLAELYVVPDERGRGLGRMLLGAAMRRARDRGATFMDLATTNQDAAAVRLYESVGFDRHERGGPEVDAYYFEMDLTAPRDSVRE